jgi:hypothetical protein
METREKSGYFFLNLDSSFPGPEGNRPGRIYAEKGLDPEPGHGRGEFGPKVEPPVKPGDPGPAAHEGRGGELSSNHGLLVVNQS